MHYAKEVTEETPERCLKHISGGSINDLFNSVPPVSLVCLRKLGHRGRHAAHHMYKKQTERHEVIHAAGDNWAKHPTRFRRGAAIYRYNGVTVVDGETPEFTKDREFLKQHIPLHWVEDERAA